MISVIAIVQFCTQSALFLLSEHYRIRARRNLLGFCPNPKPLSLVEVVIDDKERPLDKRPYEAHSVRIQKMFTVTV